MCVCTNAELHMFSRHFSSCSILFFVVCVAVAVVVVVIIIIVLNADDSILYVSAIFHRSIRLLWSPPLSVSAIFPRSKNVHCAIICAT